MRRAIERLSPLHYACCAGFFYAAGDAAPRMQITLIIIDAVTYARCRLMMPYVVASVFRCLPRRRFIACCFARYCYAPYALPCAIAVAAKMLRRVDATYADTPRR